MGAVTVLKTASEISTAASFKRPGDSSASSTTVGMNTTAELSGLACGKGVLAILVAFIPIANF